MVTGGAGGIGRALAEACLAESAAEVVIADIDRDRVEAVAAEIGAVPAAVVRDHAVRRAADNERWLRGMRRLWSASRPTPD